MGKTTQKAQKPRARAAANVGKPFTLGREGLAKISAVEGLHVPASLMQELRDLDKRGLSADERHREIMRKYGHKHGKP